MDLHYKQEIKVGMLVIIALAVLFGGMLWLTGRSVGGQGRVDVLALFSSVSGLTNGDPVMISGVQVGRVSNVHLEATGRVVVTLDIEERVRPHTDASAAVRALDFLGSKFIAYDPGTADAMLPADSLIEGTQETDLASNAGDIAASASRLFDQSDAMLTQVRATMVAAQQALDVLARIGRGPLVGEAESTLVVVRSAASRIDSTLGNPAIGKSIDQLDELTTNVNEMAAGLAVATNSLGRILTKMDSTGGTMGRLMNDSTLYVDLHETLTQLKLLLEDIRLRPGRYAPGAIKIF